MKKYLLIFFLNLFLITGINVFCFAVPANPNFVEIEQPDGKKIKIRTKGDEFYNWTEDKDGYTIVKDTTTKFWTYAQKDRNGKLKPSKNIVGKTKTLSLGIKKNIKDDNEFNEAKQNRRKFNEQLKNKFNSLSKIKKSPFKSDLSQNNLASSQVQQTVSLPAIEGKKKNFVLLIQFKDLSFTDNPPFNSYKDDPDKDEKIRNIFKALFNEEGYNAYGAVGSVKDYFKEVSYGKLEYESEISPIITLEFADDAKNKYTYYSYSNGEDTSFRRTREMIKQALKQLHDSGYNFKNIWPNATEPEGFTIIHAGGGAESGNRSFIWSHTWSFYPSITYNDITFTGYHVEPAGKGYYGSDGLVRIGTICHESIHFFGITDLYDTVGTSEGLGKFCIMASGSWNGENGKSPAHPCAWVKYKLGWIELKVAKEGINYIAEAETIKKEHDRFYIFSPFSSKEEYFLMENRQSVGFDKELPGNKKGILIYHIDETRNNNDDYTHYMVDIEEADGTADWTKDHLATGANRGLDSDYFRSDTVTVFNDSCTYSPNSKSYSQVSSGIDISGISTSGSTMYFYLPVTINSFADNLDSTGLQFVNLIMKYKPAKTIDDIRNLSDEAQERLARYFTLTESGAKDANAMGAIYFDYMDNKLVYGIPEDKTGVVTNKEANLIIKLNSLLTISQQEITSVGNISEQNDSPLNNLILYSDSNKNKSSSSLVSSTDKRFTGTIAVEYIKKYVENWGCLIYSFNEMNYRKGYDIVEVTTTTNIKDYLSYSLIKGKKSEYFNGLSDVVIYPNPARQGIINFINLPTETTDLEIEIYTITGHFIKKFNLDDTSITITGNRTFSWDCKNYSGSPLAPGVYIALLKSNSEKKKIKFAIIR